ncbi:DUF3857 domain-containing transglutaminase family protein [Chondrinema litorale]|uniref:DUF3857 domain-containing transglutaminase family protein n=1 Tax=Chondrinema litorale TaxID=2994555 RepID=UPI002542F9DE|nr:DUF3857 domain-containing transglutaminase family protein [Chondrinema litorale]UZR98187.1 DUF3857 domain-containing transglutaminase family protein [Chondrinema litorale]
MIKERLLSLIALVLMFPFSVLAGDIKFPARDIPEELKGDAVAVLRLDEREFTVVSYDKGILKKHWAYTVLKSTGDDYATFVERYDNLVKIDNIKGYIYDANGKLIKKLKNSDIIDQSNISGFSLYEDNRIKVANLEHHSYPYTVEFECEIEYDGLYYYPIWNPQRSRKISVQDASITVKMPQDLGLRYHETNVDAVKISNEDGLKVYKWTVANLPAYEYEPFSDRIAYEKMVMLAPTKFGIEGETGEMSDWQSYGKFYAKLNSTTRDLSESTKSKLKNLTANAKSEKEKVAIIYDYLQNKTRYVSIQVGIGGIKPFPASTVDEKGYGDCKALSNYTKAMLEAVGIESYYTLVGADDDFFPVKRDFPADYFNHVILCVPLKQDTVWLECTSQTQAFGYMSEFTGDRDVLAITPEGGKLLHTPAYNKDVNYTKRKAVVDIDESGNAAIEVSTKYSTLQEGSRSWICENSQEDQKKWLYEHIDLSNISIEDFELKRIKTSLPYIDEKLKIKAPKFSSVSGKRIFVSPNILSKWDYMPSIDEDRVRDVHLSNQFDFVDTDTIEFHLPEKYHIEYQPEPVTIETQFGKYEMKIEADENVIRYFRKLEMNPGTFPSDSYNELREFFKDVTKNDKVKVVLVNNT